MNAEIFAEWFRRQGHRVIRTESSYWYDQGPRVFLAFPYHWCIQPTEQELQEFLFKERALGLRYSTPLKAAHGHVSYHTIFDSASYDLEVLSTKGRSKVRRGLKRALFEPIPMERLADEGWSLQLDTMARQNRIGGLSRARWRQLCLSAKGLAGFEAWAGIIEGKLAASILVARVDDTYYILYTLSHRQYFKSYINNALTYIVSHELLSRPGVRTIFYGVQSLDAPPSMDEFKFHMRYKAKPVRQRVSFHPLTAPLFNQTTYKICKQVLKLCPGRPKLAKVEGMLRFYLEGKRPLDEQNWPLCLSPYHAEHY